MPGKRDWEEQNLKWEKAIKKEGNALPEHKEGSFENLMDPISFICCNEMTFLHILDYTPVYIILLFFFFLIAYACTVFL